MNFSSKIAIKNISRKPFRSVAMAMIVMLLSLSLFAGAFTILSLRRGLDSYKARLGADIVVTPTSYEGHGTVDDVLLQGITGNYYMNGKDCSKVTNTEGIESASRQFFLTSAKASCCSTRVQIIGFDPETDFSVLPWIVEEYDGSIDDGEVVVGSKINMPADRQIKFYGEYYRVAAQLRETGTGLDSAVYANMNTIRRMADSAADLFGSSMFKGVDVKDGASAIMIKVAEGYEITDVADDINIHITKAKATPVRSMISGISDGLGSISSVIGWLIAAIWLLSVIVLIAAFALLINERKKELAVLRVMGASRSMISRIMGMESLMISAAGSLIGVVLAMLMVFPITDSISASMELPMLRPGGSLTALILVAVIAISVMTAFITSRFSSRRITGGEAALLLREDA